MFTRVYRDICTIYTILFNGRRQTTENHAENLELFYKSQVADYDRFREKMLWGRTPLLRAIIAHMSLGACKDLVWVDVGGGTGSNVEKMSEIASLSAFKKIYIVDLCPSMCAAARERVLRMGWSNVVVECADASQYKLPINECADIVTFSYSLSMIPNFYAAIDNAYDMLSPNGMIGVTDFAVNQKASWVHRMFWTSFFDTDGIRLSPERKQYLLHRFDSYYDYSTTGRLPYLMLSAPYYLWLGCKQKLKRHDSDNVMIRRSKAPAFFPPSFLYHQSWEDPDVDEPILDVRPGDTCLTLTSGGCNTLYLLLKGAKQVVSVDVNPAQTALLELKSVAIKYLDYDDFWKLFGEGKHENFDDIFDNQLAPFLSETSRSFWESRRHYFEDGLYFHGSMGKVCKIVRATIKMLGLSTFVDNVLNAKTMEEQIVAYTDMLEHMPKNKDLVMYLTLNKWVAWMAGGVPSAQVDLITKDGLDLMTYVKRCLHNMVMNSHIRNDNYFYYNLLAGQYTKTNCPAYLRYDNFMALKNGLINNLYISNDYFLSELRQRRYDKVIMMDHADWQSSKQTRELSEALYAQMNTGGRIILRSAALIPPYIMQLQKAGFDTRCVDNIENEKGYMDRVNMYASFYVCQKNK